MAAVWRQEKLAEQEAEEERAKRLKNAHEWTYYVDKDIEEDPDRSFINEWMAQIAYTYWTFGVVQVVRVAFTKGKCRAEKKPWGDVIYINVDVAPDGLLAIWLVRDALALSVG